MVELDVSKVRVGEGLGLVVWGAPPGSSVLEIFFESDGDRMRDLTGGEGLFRCLPQAIKSCAKREWPQAVGEFYMYRVCRAAFDAPTQVGGGTIVFISRQVPQLDLVEEVKMFVELMARRVLV